MAQKAYQILFNGTAVDNDFYGDVMSVKVEENTGVANTLNLKLATRVQDDGTWRYLEDDRLQLYAQVAVKMGFTASEGLAGALGLAGGGDDGMAPIFTGYVTGVNFESGSQPGQSSINVTGMDTSVLLSLEEKIATWDNMSDSDIVQQIVGGYGVEIQADATTTVHQENDTRVVQRGSDIHFIRDLAQKNSLEFYFETDKGTDNVIAFLKAPQLDSTPQPDLALQFADASNLKSFSAQMTGHRPLSVKVEQIDIKANSPNSAQIGDTQYTKLGANDPNALVGGPLGSLVTPADAVAQMLVLGSPTSDAGELETIAQAVRDEASWFISAHGEVNAEAYQNVLRPHRLVLVKGAGKPFSGKYYVTRVVHEMRSDGSYTQTFEARRNARDVDGSEQFGQSSLGLPIPGL